MRRCLFPRYPRLAYPPRPPNWLSSPLPAPFWCGCCYPPDPSSFPASFVIPPLDWGLAVWPPGLVPAPCALFASRAVMTALDVPVRDPGRYGRRPPVFLSAAFDPLSSSLSMGYHFPGALAQWPHTLFLPARLPAGPSASCFKDVMCWCCICSTGSFEICVPYGARSVWGGFSPTAMIVCTQHADIARAGPRLPIAMCTACCLEGTWVQRKESSGML